MSTFDGEENRREIIIVKRGNNDHEDGHHGGVWKIAFADFMTAMMCFFLVMWLVNAANEETKAAIASYFNPMTLVDRDPASEGVDEEGLSPKSSDNIDPEAEKAEEEPVATMNEQSGPAQIINSVDQEETRETSDEHLFADPYAVLAEIAKETATLQNVSTKGDGGAQASGPASGAQGGESYRDPFAPDFWSQEVASEEDAELDVFREQQGDEEQPVEEYAPIAEQQAALETDASELPETDEQAADPKQEAGGHPQPVEPEAMTESARAAEETKKLADEIRDEIDDAFGQNAELNQTISVTADDDGVLISVTDELNYGMFEIGSAVPEGELVLAMEKISKALNAHTGKIRINGHTDGRPFRSETYDNWRLSTARAHAAYYMLVRAGMDEARISEVAGFADRKLKVPGEPLADANRRIEILLETGG